MSSQVHLNLEEANEAWLKDGFSKALRVLSKVHWRWKFIPILHARWRRCKCWYDVQVAEHRLRRRRRARPNEGRETTSAATEAIEADLVAWTSKLQFAVCNWKLQWKLLWRPHDYRLIFVFKRGCFFSEIMRSLNFHQLLSPRSKVATKVSCPSPP